MLNRNRTVNRFLTKVLIWIAKAILGELPTLGPIFKIAFFVLA